MLLLFLTCSPPSFLPLQTSKSSAQYPLTTHTMHLLHTPHWPKNQPTLSRKDTPTMNDNVPTYIAPRDNPLSKHFQPNHNANPPQPTEPTHTQPNTQRIHHIHDHTNYTLLFIIAITLIIAIATAALLTLQLYIAALPFFLLLLFLGLTIISIANR